MLNSSSVQGALSNVVSDEAISVLADNSDHIILVCFVETE